MSRGHDHQFHSRLHRQARFRRPRHRLRHCVLRCGLTYPVKNSDPSVADAAIQGSTSVSTAITTAKQIGADTVFSVDAETTLPLKGVDLANLAADYFRFV
ncbi:hypothetical protein [Bosea lathyri]|uniref:hypothetical protein n=1 Tax=Bosea lathyri TaxID=1036778 RepID=UPI0011B0149C|nr:hypothetical protein [Bosea lathyri]